MEISDGFVERFLLLSIVGLDQWFSTKGHDIQRGHE